ncbi:dienelactone hydrolase [Bradyrhizobium sp. MOS002]|nr:dienelactone hydrolase [Bradyrhizobium sp. MOS002]
MLAKVLACLAILSLTAAHAQELRLEEQLLVLPLPIPVLAYVVKPLLDAPLPLVVMNHGETLDPKERSFYPTVEFRAAAFWFARRGYLVVVPIRPGFGSAAIDLPDQGVVSTYFGAVGKCTDANFRAAGIAIARLNQWVIDYVLDRKLAAGPGTIVVGQSGGGWGALALSSLNPAGVRAIITFEAGRGGRVDGKPNNNCAPDKLVEAAREFGRSARVPVLSIYTENDTYFGPSLSRKLLEAYRAAGGTGEYHLLPPFGNEGHFLLDDPNAIPIWSPVVSGFLEAHP